MKKSKTKLISVSILILAFALLFSTIAYARPITDIFGNGLIQINNFFVQEQFRAYAATIDFFFFALLFIAIYMMGARYAFKEIKRPEQVIVILLGLMTAFLLVIGGFSATILLPYIHWLLYLLLFILLWHLLKDIKNKFWRFLLALLLTLLIIGFFAWLFNLVTTPEIGGISPPSFGMGDFFKSFGDSLKGVDFGGYVPGIPPYVRDALQLPSVPAPTPSPTGPPTPTGPPVGMPGAPPPEKGGIFGTGYSWWWLLLLLLLLFLFKRPRDLVKDLFKEEKKEGAVEVVEKPSEEETEQQKLQKIIDEINKIIELKQKILKKIREILDKKKKLTRNFLDLYHKKISDPAFLRDRESEAFRNLMQEQDDVTKLLKLELELEEDLVELREVEEDLSGTSLKQGKLVEWGEFIRAYYAKSGEALQAAPEFYMQALGKMSAAFKRLMDGNQGVVPEIKEIIARFFLLAKKEEEVEKLLKQLTDYDKLRYWLKEGKYERWIAIQNKEGDALKQYFTLEETTFFEGQLNPKVNLEMRYLQLIIKIINFLESERKSFTQLQDLKVDIKINNEWREITEQATNPNMGVAQGVPLKVYSRLAEGLLPIKCGCYVNGVKIEEFVINEGEDKYKLIEFELTRLNLQLGEHTITFFAISARGTYVRRDVKHIKIVIIPSQAPPPVTPPPTREEIPKETKGMLQAGTPPTPLEPESPVPLAVQETVTEEIELRKEFIEFDEWFARQKTKAEIKWRRSQISEYKKEFLEILKITAKEAAQVGKRIKKSKKAKRNEGEIERLKKELKKNLKMAKKSYRFEYLDLAKDNIYDLISLSSDSTIPVGYRQGKTKTPYNRAKEKQELGRFSKEERYVGHLRAETPEGREAYERYKQLQAQQGTPMDPRWNRLQMIREKMQHTQIPTTSAQTPPASGILAFYNDFFNDIKNYNLGPARDKILFGRQNRILDDNQYKILNELLNKLSLRSSERFDRSLEHLSTDEARTPFEELKPEMEVIEKLKQIVEHLQNQNANYILTLTPTNSKPNDPIQIIGKYHISEDDVFIIGKGGDSNLILENTTIQDTHQALIGFDEQSKRFIIRKSKNTALKTNTKEIANIDWLGNGELEINDYKFIVRIYPTDEAIPSSDIYNRNFPIKLKRK